MTAFHRVISIGIGLLTLTACNADSDDDKKEEVDQEWVDANNAYYDSEASRVDADGSLFYTRIVPQWNSNASILMHRFTDPALTAGNLVPMITSTVNVKYEGKLYDGTVFDNSYSATDSLYTTKVSNVVEGWAIALCNMHVMDSVRVVIPAGQGYGSSSHGSIPAFSTLVFDIKLVDIPGYEIP